MKTLLTIAAVAALLSGCAAWENRPFRREIGALGAGLSEGLQRNADLHQQQADNMARISASAFRQPPPPPVVNIYIPPTPVYKTPSWSNP